MTRRPLTQVCQLLILNLGLFIMDLRPRPIEGLQGLFLLDPCATSLNVDFLVGVAWLKLHVLLTDHFALDYRYELHRHSGCRVRRYS